MIRTLNPNAKIVLHLHAEWCPKTIARPSRGVRDVDLVTTVSDYVTQKTRRDFPMIADRVETTYNGIDAVEFNRDRDHHATSRRDEKRIIYAGAVSPQFHLIRDSMFCWTPSRWSFSVTLVSVWTSPAPKAYIRSPRFLTLLPV